MLDRPVQNLGYGRAGESGIALEHDGCPLGESQVSKSAMIGSPAATGAGLPISLMRSRTSHGKSTGARAEFTRPAVPRCAH